MGWEGRRGFSRNKSIGGSDLLESEEETKTPVHPFRGFFDPEWSGFFRKITGVSVPLD